MLPTDKRHGRPIISEAIEPTSLILDLFALCNFFLNSLGYHHMDLSLPISSVDGIGPKYAKKLEKLEIKTVEDFLYHIPFRYQDYSEISHIDQFPLGATATIRGEIINFENVYTKKGRKIQVAEIYDGTGKVSAVWFNQPFLARVLPPGTKLSLSGELNWWKKKKAIYGPDYEIIDPDKAALHTGRLVPIYHSTGGVSSKWIRSKMYSLLETLELNPPPDFWSESFLKDQNLLPRVASLKKIHFPDTESEAELARARLAFDELVWVQIQQLYRKLDWQHNQPTHKLKLYQSKIQQFVDNLPFVLTKSQERSINEILEDLTHETPMNRLLEGDVGSGKTVVAAIAAFLAYLNGKRAVFMAPTQILAEQHYLTLTKLFEKQKTKITLITGARKMDSSKSDIVVGTHALLHTTDNLANAAIIVIDEQHRFGVEQRAHLVQKTQTGKVAPHVLTMTATPIPRTIALALYSELQLSTLDELPSGRLPIKTWIVPSEKREPAYEWIHTQISEHNSQVYVVCPLIEESENELLAEVKAAKAQFEHLQKVFPSHKLGLLHGKLKASDKNKILDQFREKKIDILVTTPVIEVGVDVPNATIMMIEAADRFGLASLHQLRGRVGRGDKQSYCLLLTQNNSDKTTSRLEALKQTLSGFKLAELDMQMRGPGEILGTRQHGASMLKIASWQDIDLIKKSKTVAEEVVKEPKKFKELHKALKRKQAIAN